MAKTIRVTLDNIAEAVAELNRYADELDGKVDTICRKLASTARVEALVQYSASSEKINVSPSQKIPNGYKISATGEWVVAKDGTPGNTVVFAEFGAGFGAGRGHPLMDEFQAYPASWSEHDSQQFATKEYWYYNKKRYTEIAPTRAMYLAGEKAKLKAIEVAREVFT